MTKVKALYDDLEYQGAMKEHLTIQKQQFIGITEEISSLEAELHEVGNKLSDLTYQVKSPFIREEPEPRVVKQLAEVQAEYNQLSQKKEQLLRRQQQVNQAVTLQEEAIANNHLLNPIALQDVLNHQENISLAKVKIDRINRLIQDQTPLINSLTTAELPLQSLLLQKEDILADIEIGRNCGQELAEIDQQIELVMANMEQAQEVGDKAKATQLGLERKLAEAKQALAALEAKSRGVIECLLRGLAEEEGQHYFKLADELQKAFIRLQGLHQLIAQKSPNRNSICLNQQGLKIPAFNLECAEQYRLEAGSMFFDWDHQLLYEKGDWQAVKMVRQELINAGVMII